MKFSRAYLEDKIHACWLGKNIGGTIGTPYEGRHDILDVKGFITKKGEPLANDDLDLQMAWLKCMDDLGPEQVNSKTLGEYWLSYVKPHWCEYGVCKANMRAGFVPPVSGEIFNNEWKHSNGAWIRTEIWACLYPGQVEKAIKYAFEDASVDHGFGEGTYAAIFVAAMESAAFLFDDIRVILNIALSKIPEDCRIAKAVRLVIEEFDKGTDWKVTRNMLVEQSADIGWFQAPANVAFSVLGLLYGGCDFKKSMLTAVNCADDTDCTAATVGALLGIMYGSKGLPEDWVEFLGDKIVTGCLLFGHCHFPETCTELTENVMNLHPVTLRTSMQQLYKGKKVDICDENDFSDVTAESLMGTKFVDELKRRTPCSFTAENVMATAYLNFDEEPVITEEKPLTGYVYIMPRILPESRKWTLRWILPEGWKVKCRGMISTNNNLDFAQETNKENCESRFTITCCENPKPENDLLLDIYAPDRPTHLVLPIKVIVG